jgi:hypothetical protein
MTTYTKTTTITFQDTPDLISIQFRNALMIKANQMKLADKTDGIYSSIDEYRLKRVWLDQAAADEWVLFVTGRADYYNVVVTDYHIDDNIVTI